MLGGGLREESQRDWKGKALTATNVKRLKKSRTARHHPPRIGWPAQWAPALPRSWLLWHIDPRQTQSSQLSVKHEVPPQALWLWKREVRVPAAPGQESKTNYRLQSDDLSKRQEYRKQEKSFPCYDPDAQKDGKHSSELSVPINFLEVRWTIKS